ncbi:MAG: PAS domain S-box protein [Phycisphaerae bacterium]
MLVEVILGLSILLQFAAAGMAIWMVRVRPRRWGWMLIATAIVLMGVRRCITMFRLLSGDSSMPPDIPAELVALAISCCFVVGIGLFVRPRHVDADEGSFQNLVDASVRRLSRTAVGLGVLAIVGSCLLALQAYRNSRQAILADVSTSLLQDAGALASVADSFAVTLGTDAILRWIQTQSSHVSYRYSGTSICVLDDSGTLLLDTGRPDAVGTNMADMPVAVTGWEGPVNLGAMLDTQESWIGSFANSSGERQIGAFVPLTVIGGYVGIHAPQASIDAKVWAQTAPLGIAVVVLALVFFPMSIAMLHRSYASAQRTATSRLVALRESREHLHRAVKTARMGTFDWDVVQDRATHSEELDRIFGFEPGGFGSRVDDFLGLVHPQDCPNVRETVFRCAQEGGHYQVDYRICLPDREVRWMAERAQAYKDESGCVRRIIGVVQDITERKQAEEALRTSESRFRRHFELGAIGMGTSSPDKSWLEVNDRFCDLMGYSRDELLSMTWNEMTHPDDLARNVDLFEDALAGKRESYVLDKRFIRKDGGVVDVILSAVAIRKQDGSVDYFLILVQDITERKRAEEKLRLAHFAIDHCSDPIYWIRADGGIAYANQAACDSMGYTREELLSMSVPQIDPDFPAETWVAHWGEMRASGSMTFESHHRTKDGRVFPVEITTNYMDYHGQQYAWAYVRDTTERRTMEADRARLAAAIEQSAEAVLITDRDGTIQYVNPAFETITGYTRREAVGQNPRLLKSGFHDPLFYEDVWERISAGKVWSGRFTNTRKDGSRYEENATISPVRDAAGNIVNFVGVKRDVTHELELEAQLRQSQKMEAVGHLASGVAHDLNNLLAVISTGSSLLRSEVGDNTKALAWLDSMNQAVHQATDVTRTLLTFGRKLPAQKRTTQLQEVVESATRMLRHSLLANVELVEQIDADRPIWVNADPTQIQQIVLNLTLNARDAMPDGGTLRVRVTPPEVFPEEASPATSPESLLACITVTDTGTGIPSEIQSRIFDPFFTTKPRGQGTGLGLSAVHGIVENHGGRVQVDSEAGRGTSFKVYLPCVAPGDMPGFSTTAPPAGFVAGGTVLLAEDHTQVREIIAASLCTLGFAVKPVADGDELLKAVHEAPADLRLLVLDLDLPKRDGLDCLRRLRARGWHTPVIVVTGGDTAHLGDLENERTVLLRKPFPVEDLQRLALRLVSGCQDEAAVPAGGLKT